MTLSRSEFTKGLRERLSHGHDAVRIARWAYVLHLSARAFEEGLEGDIVQLMAMDMGEEFELTEEAIYRLANRE